MPSIRHTIAAAAVLVAAGLVSLINAQPATTTPVTPPATSVVITGTHVPVEGDADWDCHVVSEHSNGICGSDLPEGFTVADIAECTDRARYADCPAAVRERLSR
jgi:phage tail sheath gpL-like